MYRTRTCTWQNLNQAHMHPRPFHLASFPGSLLKNGEGREPGNKANFHQALAKVKMKQSQICWQYCILNHMIAAKLHMEGTPVHTPVNLQSGQLLSEVLYLYLPLLPGNMCLKLLRQKNNNSAHHHTIMDTPYQNYNRASIKISNFS